MVQETRVEPAEQEVRVEPTEQRGSGLASILWGGSVLAAITGIDSELAAMS